MELVIVESPTKARTLSKFLGKDYDVVATMGHVRDLPQSKLGVDFDHDFAPQYVTLPDKKKTIDAFVQAARLASKIYLASDPDREGEAIAYHVAELLRNPERKSKNSKVKTEDMKRIVFHEITESAIREALANPRDIDMDLVDAQQARRILDRVVGYKLSPLLWRKVRRGLSAGRVQSVTVRLIVEREREIEKFVSRGYYKIWGAFSAGSKDVFVAELVEKDGKAFSKTETAKLFAGDYKVTETSIKSENEADNLVLDLEDPFKIQDVEKKESLRRPSPPFTTSTLAQSAGRKLGMTSRNTMRVAQKLYEEGLITYHRTDSTNLAAVAIDSMRDYIGREFGKVYVPAKPNFYKTKSRVAQEAHEAIRPTDVSEKLKVKSQKLRGEAERLYELIWKQAVASQMAPARFEDTRITIISANDYRFRVAGMRVLFDGFWKVMGRSSEENTLPELEKGEIVDPVSFGTTEHKTQPPPRYSEASLIATLEKEEIGRPSTYAPTISTILDRRYVEKTEGRFFPTPIGIAANDFLVANFPGVVDLPFTANLEGELDNIANGKSKWVPVIKNFWVPFSEKLEVAGGADRVKIIVEETGEDCPKCKEGKADVPVGRQIIRVGRFGRFLSCSRFPDCDWKEQYKEKLGMACPDCKDGEVVVRMTKKHRRFFGCSNYPKCKWASWTDPSKGEGKVNSKQDAVNSQENTDGESL